MGTGLTPAKATFVMVFMVLSVEIGSVVEYKGLAASV